MKWIALTAGIIFLQGCVSFEPVPEKYDGPLATVSDSSKRISSTKVHFFQLRKIDGRDVSTSSYETRVANDGRGFLMSPITSARQVPAQRSRLTIQGVTHVAAPILALGGGMYSVEGVVDLDLIKNETYYVKGELSSENSSVWVEDSAGHIISKIIKEKINSNEP